MLRGMNVKTRFVLSLITLSALLGGCSKAPPAVNVPVADRARALVIRDSGDLIGGPKASGRVGDLLIANTKVRFIIAAAGRSRAWFPTGGVLLDADVARPAGQPGDDRLQEMVTRVGNLRMLYADTVEVASDGSDGGDAVVRVTGHDASVPILQSVLPMPANNVAAVTEYRLAPYAQSLVITTTVTDQSGAAQTIPVGDVFVLADFVTLFAPGYGTDKGALMNSSGLRYFAAFGGSVSYGFVAPGRKLGPIFPQAEIFALGTDRLALDAKGSATFSRAFAVGSGDVASLLPEIVRREGGDPSALVNVSGTVSEQTTMAKIGGAQVGFGDANGPYLIAVTDGSGHYQAALERGSYSTAAIAAERTGQTQTVDVSTGMAVNSDLKLTDTGSFTVDIKDAQGGSSPARLQLYAKDGTSFGYYLSPDGKGSGLLPPGDYRAIVSRGFEWEDAVVNFSVAAGKASPIAATIARVVDSTGWVAIDSHTHTAVSVDSQLDPHVRVAHALADGVELVITTDHDVAFDLAPTVTEMGLTGGFATAVGCEVSPVPGHINGYPVVDGPAADTDGYWGVKWWSETAQHEFIVDLWPTDIFAGLRSKMSAEVVQLNHPRSGQGVLNWVGYDAARGMKSVDPKQLDLNWDVIEVCNSGCDPAPDSEDGKSLSDYFSFLNQGFRKGAVGVSDEHGSGGWLGRARTMVEVHDDDPKTLDPKEVWMSLKSGRAVVLAGAFATLTVKDDSGTAQGVGTLAKATKGPLALHVKVQAPSWIPTDRIRVIENGADVKAVPIPAAMGAPSVVRFDGDIAIDPPATDAWLLVIVEGDTAMAPVLGAHPRTITNPVFIDRNGNGTFEAPGL
jgi:hypothetical protein